ncbi:MAG: hypothetical protein GYA23_13870, partial [Methanomicrobiales archaeon]|nr:hypothetical protein [Methanomicrobiales archaeon]
VIGDVNEGNILVDSKACVRLIDCDSFQVRAEGTLFPCEVGVAHFTPPEIQAEKHYHMVRTANHDNFGLAILIFQLLFLGRHPYAGVYSGKDDMPIERAILEFRYAYGKNAGARMMAPPPNSVGPSIVPGDVAELFEIAFSEAGTRPGSRPAAGDWWDALEALENRMQRCRADAVHWHYAGLSSCPWCRLEENSGLLIFLSADSITKIDLKREWEKIEAVLPPGPCPSVLPGNFPHRPVPLPPKAARSLAFRGLRQLAAAGIVIICLLLIIMEADPGYYLSLGGGVLALGLVLFPDEASNEKKRRRLALKNARYLWDLWNKKWIEEAGDTGYYRQLNHLREQKRKFEAIEEEYHAALSALERGTRDRQLFTFLMKFSIDMCTSTRITPAAKVSLKAAGIRTAADVNPAALIKVPALDSAVAGELMLWRERSAKNFLFDSSKGVEPADTRALVQKYQPIMKPVERELRTGSVKLAKIAMDIQKNRTILMPQIGKRARELAQAEADFEIFAKTMEEMVARDIRGILGQQ